MTNRETIEFRHEETEYNGWTNWATWNVALWINNEQAMHTHWHGMAEAEMRDEDASDLILTNRIAHNLKSAFGAKFGMDHALGLTKWDGDRFDARHEVNWTEVAESLMQTVREYHEYGDTFLSR